MDAASASVWHHSGNMWLVGATTRVADDIMVGGQVPLKRGEKGGTALILGPT